MLLLLLLCCASPAEVKTPRRPDTCVRAPPSCARRCVPHKVKNLLFIDVGRAGGSTARKYLEQGRATLREQPGALSLVACNLAPAMADRVFCHSMVSAQQE